MTSIQVNIGDHTSPIVSPYRYMPWPQSKRRLINWARWKAKWIARTMPSADAYFRTLPDGRSLTDLLHDRSIWINYSPTMPYYGESVLSGKELCISERSCRIGRWTVLGTLIHELAHINGAPGGHSKQAEEALLHTGLGRLSEKISGIDDPNTPYDPDIEG